MSETIPLSELDKIPHVDTRRLHGRSLPTLGFHTPENGWELWLYLDGQLRRMRPIPGEADFFAAAPTDASDLCLYFLNVLGKRTLWPDLIPKLRGLRDDLHNIGAALATIDLLVHLHRTGEAVNAGRQARTQLEQLHTVTKSMFDTFHEAFVLLWRRVHLNNAPRTPVKRLPDHYARLILAGDRPKTPDELTATYGLPDPIATALATTAGFFQPICATRNRIVHDGHPPAYVYATDHGFAIPADTEPFASFPVWEPATYLPNDLASLRPALAYLIWNTLASFDSVLHALITTIEYPEDPLPQFQLFTRGSHTSVLHEYAKVAPEDPWWPAP